MAVRRILDELVDGVRTPERPASPIDFYITDEEKFERLNPGVSNFFHPDFHANGHLLCRMFIRLAIRSINGYRWILNQLSAHLNIFG